MGGAKPWSAKRAATLLHDLLHYAVETEAKLDGGFWGNLEKGRTLEQMNDRTGKSMQAESPQLGIIEGVVGPMSGAVKGLSAADLVAGFARYAEAMESRAPDWVTEEFVLAVQKRMRELQGAWKATPFGGVMELGWPRR